MSLNESDKTSRHKEVKNGLTKAVRLVIKRRNLTTVKTKRKRKHVKFDKLRVEQQDLMGLIINAKNHSKSRKHGWFISKIADKEDK